MLVLLAVERVRTVRLENSCKIVANTTNILSMSGSLLRAILGELWKLESGAMASVDGTVAFVAQESCELMCSLHACLVHQSVLPLSRDTKWHSARQYPVW